MVTKALHIYLKHLEAAFYEPPSTAGEYLVMSAMVLAEILAVGFIIFTLVMAVQHVPGLVVGGVVITVVWLLIAAVIGLVERLES